MRLVFFKEADGAVPAKQWLDSEVARRDRRALAKIGARLELLESEGWDLRRPIADTLERGIHELRIQFGRVNYRLLYFFSQACVVVVSHGITKEGVVPPAEIDIAARRRLLFESDPERYSYYEQEENHGRN